VAATLALFVSVQQSFCHAVGSADWCELGTAQAANQASSHDRHHRRHSSGKASPSSSQVFDTTLIRYQRGKRKGSRAAPLFRYFTLSSGSALKARMFRERRAPQKAV